VEVDYRREGLRARFLIPGAYLIANALAVPPPTAIDPAPASLAGLSVLIVEDQSLIAMDIEETLRRLGVANVRLAANAKSAIDQLSNFTPDVALLDFSLGEGTSEDVADRLSSRGVPFLFATGYGDRAIIPDRFRHVTVIRKPLGQASLANQILAVRAAFDDLA
jgi:CheY-like chemotaxis protein